MKKIFSILAILGLVAAVYIALGSTTWTASNNDTAAEAGKSLVRFHVIANSDSDEDQGVKLKVRDAILSKIGSELETMDSREQALSYLEEKLPLITDTANEILKENSMNYTAASVVGQYNFPVKSYNSVTLPAGEYTALRVVLGDGDGKNWWCVMFPPLCFIDITQGLTEDTTDQQLSRVMTTKEVDSITTVMEKSRSTVKAKTIDDTEEDGKTASSQAVSSSTESQSVEFRFKTVEIIKGFINKLRSK